MKQARGAFAALASMFIATAFAAFPGIAWGAEGDDYPKRPVKLIMPNAPGSSSDTLGRLLAHHLGQAFGQQVIVENYAGAGGTIGMDMGKNAAPDGYTLVAVTPAGTSIAANLRKNLPYDPLTDFEYISMYAVLPNLLVVNPQLPVKTVQQLIDYSRSHKDQMFMASAGPGSQSHLAGEMLITMGDFPATHVPYKGGGASVVAVMSGEAQWTITPASSVLGHAKSGKLRAIAQSLPRRSDLMPDIPSVQEAVSGYSYSGWNGLALPKGTPAAIVAKIRGALMQTLARPEVKEAFAKQGAEIVTNSGPEFRKVVGEEIASTAAVVKAAKLEAD
jgi:tripartite-type tricarboxylate transporter receptor subunit TctC